MNKLKMKSVLSLGLLLLTVAVKAQSLEEGIKMYNYERYETAKRILSPLASGDAMANYYLGLSEIGLENMSGAKTVFQRFPEDAANTAGIARVLITENKSPEAISMLNKVAAKAKKKDWMPFKYAADAMTYTEGGDPNMAVEWYKKANDVQRSGITYIGMGDAYRKMTGGGGNAMSSYEYADEFPETRSLANYKMGSLWYAAKNYDSALTKFARSSELDEANPLPYKALADAYYRVSKYKLAKEKIEKYLERSDKTTTDQIEYANTLFLAQDYPNAISKMNDLVSRGEGDKRPYMFRVLGYSQFELKDYANAEKNMEKFFAKIEPKKIIPSDYIYYGKILLTDSSKALKAAEAFDKGIAIDTTKDKGPVLRQIAESFRDAQQYGTAANYYQKVLDSNSPKIEALDYWYCGAMHYYNKDYVNADNLYRQMGEKYPDEPTSYFWRGNVTVALKDKEYQNGAASEYFNKWLSMVKFEDPDKKKNLIKVYTYLAMVSYNAKKKTEAQEYNAKLLTLDPANDTGLQLVKALEAMK